MITKTIRLETIEKVYSFVAVVTKYECETDIVCGRYTVNAKSIMGIFSLDLLKPLDLVIHSDSADALLAELTPYIV